MSQGEDNCVHYRRDCPIKNPKLAGCNFDCSSYISINNMLDDLTTQLKIAVKRLGYVKECGHNDDCLFCAMKDTIADKALADIKAVK